MLCLTPMSHNFFSAQGHVLCFSICSSKFVNILLHFLHGLILLLDIIYCFVCSLLSISYYFCWQYSDDETRIKDALKTRNIALTSSSSYEIFKATTSEDDSLGGISEVNPEAHF
ncbi:pre-mRNA-processing protein 40A isoform X1 [Iris pallida]|uniref:Pre-mRNA-processing protein 40A isoform X1 n=1 Tax=Iris pallida TaxID=29817 RepID=A0AAX6GM51_IRIPA|nr:pre-mRNA-processing protein 40A isoform X1 [Iris pallida]